MKICLVIPSFYPAISYGGPIVSSLNACRELSRLPETEIKVVTTNVNNGSSKLKVIRNKWVSFEKLFKIKYYNVILSGFSLRLFFGIYKDIKGSDIVHIQGIFNSTTPIALFWSAIFRKPIILSPRGVLAEWCLENRKILKKIWLSIFIKPFAGRLTWHVTGITEKKEILTLYEKAQIEIVPNGVYIQEFKNFEKLKKPNYLYKFSKVEKKKINKLVISMGRLTMKKGFDLLIKAFNKVLLKYPDSYLLIAGPEETEGPKLKKLISNLNLENNVFLIGDIRNQDKVNFLVNADVFVLPSHNENFGNVFLESLAAGTPIVASLDTPWQISEFRKCGKWVNNDVSNIYSAIVDLLGEDRINIRNNCLKLSEEFDWSIIAFKFDEIYRKLSVKI